MINLREGAKTIVKKKEKGDKERKKTIYKQRLKPKSYQFWPRPGDEHW